MGILVYDNGVLRERGDDATRTYTAWDHEGTLISTRPYTDQENADADAQAVEAQAANNRASIEQALSEALVALQGIIDLTNSTINSNPAAHIKDIARIMRRQIRLLIRRLDGTS